MNVITSLQNSISFKTKREKTVYQNHNFITNHRIFNKPLWTSKQESTSVNVSGPSSSVACICDLPAVKEDVLLTIYLPLSNTIHDLTFEYVNMIMEYFPLTAHTKHYLQIQDKCSHS